MAGSPLSRSHAVCWSGTLVCVVLRTRCRGRRPHWACESGATPRGFPTEGGRRDCSSTELRLERFLPPECALLESTSWPCELLRTLRGLDSNIPRCRRSAHCACMQFQSSLHTPTKEIANAHLHLPQTNPFPPILRPDNAISCPSVRNRSHVASSGFKVPQSCGLGPAPL